MRRNNLIYRVFLNDAPEITGKLQGVHMNQKCSNEHRPGNTSLKATEDKCSKISKTRNAWVRKNLLFFSDFTTNVEMLMEDISITVYSESHTKLIIYKADDTKIDH